MKGLDTASAGASAGSTTWLTRFQVVEPGERGLTTWLTRFQVVEPGERQRARVETPGATS